MDMYEVWDNVNGISKVSHRIPSSSLLHSFIAIDGPFRSMMYLLRIW